MKPLSGVVRFGQIKILKWNRGKRRIELKMRIFFINCSYRAITHVKFKLKVLSLLEFRGKKKSKIIFFISSFLLNELEVTN